MGPSGSLVSQALLGWLSAEEAVLSPQPFLPCTTLQDSKRPGQSCAPLRPWLQDIQGLIWLHSVGSKPHCQTSPTLDGGAGSTGVMGYACHPSCKMMSGSTEEPSEKKLEMNYSIPILPLHIPFNTTNKSFFREKKISQA